MQAMTTYSHVLEVFAEKSEERAWVGVPSFWLTLARHSWLLLLLQARLTRKIKATTREVEGISLHLSGFTHRYPRMVDSMSPQEEDFALAVAQRSEEHCMGVRKSILEMIQMVKPFAENLPVLSSALATWNGAAVDAFEAAQEMRWVILESQAQRDIDQGHVQRFDSAAAAINSLRS